MYREQSPLREAIGTVGIRLAWITCLAMSAILGVAVMTGKF